jgi:hypothetical protein
MIPAGEVPLQRQPVAPAEPEPPSATPGPPIVPVLPVVEPLPSVGPGCTAPARAPLAGAVRPMEPLEPSVVEPRFSGAAAAPVLPGTVPGVAMPVPGTEPDVPGRAAPLDVPEESIEGPLHGAVPGPVVICAAARPAAAMDAAAATARAIDRAFMCTSPV